MRKNIIRFLSIAIIAAMLAACGSTDSKVNEAIQNQMQDEAVSEAAVPSEIDDEQTNEGNTDGDNIDVDLTALSSTMVYSEVYNMVYTPEEYIGKTVKMSGMFVAYTNDDETQYYPAVIIADATACCSQGLEFVLEGNPVYPDGYPEAETDITVVGTFETYEEEGNTYCRLQNAKIL